MTIRVVAQRTGLSAHVIRVWERRYAAITPERTATRRRLYSGEQVERLRLMARLSKEGRSIGTIARLSTPALRALVVEQEAVPPQGRAESAPEPRFLERCLVAVRALDAGTLETVLTEAEVKLGAQGMLRRLAAPLAQALGDQWREGLISAAHEHMASAVLRSFLLRPARNPVSVSLAPCLVIATPGGQEHELGALLVCASAANLGWRVVYLGASLPAAEIAGAALQHQARAVAISLVFPEDDPLLPAELLRLSRLLPATCSLLAGGRALPSYLQALEAAGARLCRDLPQLESCLEDLRVTRGG